MDKAVAIRYWEGLPAPFLVAKGKNELARRILAIAEENGIEIVAKPDLAENLFYLERGDFIPEELYALVAELLAFVYGLQESNELH